MVILTDLRGGEIAAGDLLLRMDIAQLLTTLGLRVGAERTVASAVGVLGPDAIADCLPLLQPIALTRSTGATLKLAGERAQRERDAVLDASRQKSSPARNRPSTPRPRWKSPARRPFARSSGPRSGRSTRHSTKHARRISPRSATRYC